MSGIRYLVVQTGCESYAFRRAAGSRCGTCTLNGMEKTQVRPALGKLGALPRAPRGLASPDPPTEPAEGRGGVMAGLMWLFSKRRRCKSKGGTSR